MDKSDKWDTLARERLTAALAHPSPFGVGARIGEARFQTTRDAEN